MRSALLAAGAALLATTATPAAAQVTSPRVALVATAGYFHPDQPLRSVPQDGGPVYSGLGSAAALGLAAEVRTPVRGIAVRLSSSYTRPELEVGATPEERTTSRSTVSAVGLDGVVRGPRFGPAQPYLLLGAWVRRYDFDQDALTGGAAETYADDETRRAGHAGVGVSWNVGRWAVLAEAGGWFGEFDDADEEVVRVRQQDFHLNLGVRVPVW